MSSRKIKLIEEIQAIIHARSFVYVEGMEDVGPVSSVEVQVMLESRIVQFLPGYSLTTNIGENFHANDRITDNCEGDTEFA